MLGGTTEWAHLGDTLELEDEVAPTAPAGRRGNAGEGAAGSCVGAVAVALAVLQSMDAAALTELRD